MHLRGRGRNRGVTIAERFLRDAELLGKPCSAFVLANAAGLWLEAVRSGPARGLNLRRNEIRYPDYVAPEMQEAFVLREVAKWALYWYREPRDAESRAALTRALQRRRLDPKRLELRGNVG
jgi:hypothetical protein